VAPAISSAQLEQRLERLTGPPHDPVRVDASLLDEPGHGHWWWIRVGGAALVLAGGAAWWTTRRGGRTSAG
jgi:hypothetical protein